MSAIGSVGVSSVAMTKRQDLRIALILFVLSAFFLLMGISVHDAQHELAMFSQIEHEQGDNASATVLLQVAGSYRSIMFVSWGMGGFGLLLGVAFLALAYLGPKK